MHNAMATCLLIASYVRACQFINMNGTSGVSAKKKKNRFFQKEGEKNTFWNSELRFVRGLLRKQVEIQWKLSNGRVGPLWVRW